jgi:GTP-binding protein Era
MSGARELQPKKSAFVAIIGRPSAGKSTLLNRFCGAKVAIVSPVPQTTRNSIRGIVTRPEGQLVFVDTPGMHISGKKLNLRLLETASRVLGEADLVLYVLDASRPPGPEEEAAASALSKRPETVSGKTAAAINKIDAAGSGAAQASAAFLHAKLPELPPERIFNISALKKEGLDAVLACLFDMAPEGSAFYGDDCYTDQDVRFRIAEIIREKAINRLREELPHSIYVDVADMEFRAAGHAAAPKTLWVRAFIMAERESQKGMIVGKGGLMIRDIRLSALRDLKKIFDWKIELDLRVKTSHDWRGNDALLKKLM